MDRGENGGLTTNKGGYGYFTEEEILEHNKADDKWIQIGGKVYNITHFAKKHPGGAKIISHYSGQDATDAWVAFHDDKDLVQKYLKPLLIGEVKNLNESELEKDYRSLRQKLEKMGMFKTNPVFYLAQIISIFLMEALAVWMFWSYGVNWKTFLLSALLMCTAQAQWGWTQHDYGHLSVFKSRRVNHWAHYFTISIMKGASSHWWNFRHFQHHAKPNVIKKDPDVQLAYLFLMGDKMPVEWGEKKRGKMPYQLQHHYFFLIGPPLLLPLYFHFENVYFMVKRKDWLDLFFTFVFFYRLHIMFTPYLGGLGTFAFYMFFRFLESHWFVWVTQMNHIPNEIDRDQNKEWFKLQLGSTSNVQAGWFNNWFTGHLNFQIEHHLFPTMPRHNYEKVQPLVKSLAKKHGVEYLDKPLLTSFADIIRSLKKSGRLWFDAYYDV
ncbi:hypothetical protein LOTGIDRAFT_143229 [Lottia gigantea]|uniref:Cytochrome b5 heme-binding domain-containing protein n=1 Tax=Lottia gigantea TaxID=225164 RepID=V4AT49_LOTGI|nr:hypothetical protein LOTGIDRAFT_143229 [Lottia gigantea]ESO98065.1 hypothetical protein LOTGIDRAFT_143229 [Lottia gigantea]